MSRNLSFEQDDDLLVRFRAGDEKALNLIFNSLYNRLCLYTNQFTHDSDISEELAVDAFHKLWERRIDFSNMQALKAFLYVCTRNAALNYVDKEQRRSKKMFAFFNRQEAVEDHIMTNIIFAEVWDEIQKEIDALPEQCAKIIKLLYEMDLSPDEIAVQLNINRNTVYSQKFRGLAILKKKLSSNSFALLLAIYWYNQ
jgi:RNA polymerase sigma factor (sigma-70 family)